MAEYIEREKAWRKVNRAKNIEEALNIIDGLSTADVVPVVRCKDCRYYDVYRLECHNPHHNGIINCEGYCSYGESGSMIEEVTK